MITVIKNVRVLAPEDLGIKDIVLVGEKIEGVYDKLSIPKQFIEIDIIDGTGKIAVPGFIDSHVHIIGGGGEGGFKTRTPDIGLSQFLKAGITTAVGCIGTDGVCRSMKDLIAKARALEEEGITTYCYTGSYDIPVKSITGSVKEDIILIDKIIGIGEIALSDHRSSQATYEQFVNIVAQGRVGGLLSGKSGVVNVHLGDGARKMDYLFNLIKNTEIPTKQLLPTHVNRSKQLFEAGIEYVKNGGIIDFTTSSDPNFLEEEELTASMALKTAIDKEIPLENLTFSSDGNGSMPIFNHKKELVGLGLCSVSSLYREVRESVLKYSIPLEKAIKVITSNVANVLKLDNKGKIETDRDSDIVLLDSKNLNIDTVIAKGQKMMVNCELLVKGTFEKV